MYYDIEAVNNKDADQTGWMSLLFAYRIIRFSHDVAQT